MMTFRPSPRLGQACPERSVGPFRASTLGSTLSSKVARNFDEISMPKLTNFRPSGPCPDGQVWAILGSAKPGPKACSAKSACARDRPIPGIVRTAVRTGVRTGVRTRSWTSSGRRPGRCPGGWFGTLPGMLRKSTFPTFGQTSATTREPGIVKKLTLKRRLKCTEKVHFFDFSGIPGKSRDPGFGQVWTSGQRPGTIPGRCPDDPSGRSVGPCPDGPIGRSRDRPVGTVGMGREGLSRPPPDAVRRGSLDAQSWCLEHENFVEIFIKILMKFSSTLGPTLGVLTPPPPKWP